MNARKLTLLLILNFIVLGSSFANEVKYTIIKDETNTCNHIESVTLSDSKDESKIHVKTNIPVDECRFFGLDEDLSIYKVSSKVISVQDEFKYWEFDKLSVQRRVHIQFDDKLLYEVVFEGAVQASCYFEKAQK